MKKLNNGDRVCSNGGSIYEVVATLWSTIYLRKVDATPKDAVCTLDEVHHTYHAVEFMKQNTEH